MQPSDLKALARNVLQRNQPCNQRATCKEKPCNLDPPKNTPQVARLQAPATTSTRERLQRIAAGLGLPNSLVQNLPESEVDACREQAGWARDEGEGHALLTFYLKALAG